jgi:hypothetical protein
VTCAILLYSTSDALRSLPVLVAVATVAGESFGVLCSMLGLPSSFGVERWVLSVSSLVSQLSALSSQLSALNSQLLRAVATVGVVPIHCPLLTDGSLAPVMAAVSAAA